MTRKRWAPRLAWSLAALGLGSILTAEALKIIFDLTLGEDFGLFVPVLVGGGAMASLGPWSPRAPTT